MLERKARPGKSDEPERPAALARGQAHAPGALYEPWIFEAGRAWAGGARQTGAGSPAGDAPGKGGVSEERRRYFFEPLAQAPAAIQRACAACEEPKTRPDTQAESEAVLSSSGGSGGTCTTCDEERVDRSANGGAPRASFEPLTHGGAPLPESERAFFEPRFGRDLGSVRVHANAESAASARAVAANAYTFGDHIVFDQGRFAPGSTDGRRLLAHELAHVVQQKPGAHPQLVQRQRRPDAGADAGADAGHDGGTDAGQDGGADGGQDGGGGTAPPQISTVPAGMQVASIDPRFASGERHWVGLFNCQVTFSSGFSMPDDPRGLQGMYFGAQVTVPASVTTGRIYFIQLVRPSMKRVHCRGSTLAPHANSPSWGIDTTLPYRGSDVAARPGTIPVSMTDAPAALNLSLAGDPRGPLARICMAHDFVSYLVYDDGAGHVSSLAWVSWQVRIGGLRSGGNCPPAATAEDCSGWVFAGTGSEVGRSTTPDQMAPQQALSTALPIISGPGLVLAPVTDPACSSDVPMPGARAPAPAISRKAASDGRGSQQTSLHGIAVSQPGDALEREADATAERVLRDEPVR